MSNDKGKREINITLSAAGMLQAQINVFLWMLKPLEQRQRQRQPTFKELERLSFSVPHERFWEKMGGKVTIKDKGRITHFHVPRPSVLINALDFWLAADAREYDELSAMLHLPAKDTLSAYDLSQGLDLLEESKVPHAVAIIQRQIAISGVVCIMIEAVRRLSGDPTRRHLVNISPATFAGLEEDYKGAFENLQAYIDVLQALDWSIRSRELPPDQQFLPPGFWPRGEPQPDQEPAAPAEDEQLELGLEEIPDEDERLNEKRDRYYMHTLRCIKRLEPQKWFGGRRYVAYIYRALSGELLAILDCGTPGNAAYIFRVGTPVEGQADAWMKQAGQSKWVLLTLPEDRRGTFIRRFIHALGWPERLKEWLEGTFLAQPAN